MVVGGKHGYLGQLNNGFILIIKYFKRLLGGGEKKKKICMAHTIKEFRYHKSKFRLQHCSF